MYFADVNSRTLTVVANTVTTYSKLVRVDTYNTYYNTGPVIDCVALDIDVTVQCDSSTVQFLQDVPVDF